MQFFFLLWYIGKLFGVIETNCRWTHTNVLITTWDIEIDYNCAFASQIFITIIIKIVFCWTNLHVGLLNKHNKNKSQYLIPIWQPQYIYLSSISTKLFSINSHQTTQLRMECSDFPSKAWLGLKLLARKGLKYVLINPLCSNWINNES